MVDLAVVVAGFFLVLVVWLVGCGMGSLGYLSHGPMQPLLLGPSFHWTGAFGVVLFIRYLGGVHVWVKDFSALGWRFLKGFIVIRRGIVHG